MVEPYGQASLKAVAKLEMLAIRSQIKLGTWILLVGLAGLCFQVSPQLCKQQLITESTTRQLLCGQKSEHARIQVYAVYGIF